ncbi:diguanylate cyclase domain-containing protein [Vibrio sp. HN007]|uniref:CHASE domain-containing protein n=1 Tax=Vibrio iocasae TaxID=3098914 RepID=UPI0035D48F35
MKPTNLTVPLLIVTFGIILSAFSSWSIHKSEQSSIMNELIHDVDVRAAALHKEVVVNFEALQALAILFSNNTVPSKDQFSAEARKILARHSNIQALEWIPRVQKDQREQFEQMLQQYYPYYEFVERQGQGSMISAEVRPEYYPVYYLEPLIGNENALGFDLASSKQRLETLQQARDMGEPLASSSITLIQDINNQKGFLAFIPIYKGVSVTAQKRSENLVGFVLGVFRIQDIFLSSSLTKTPLGITMTLVDETIADQPETLHHHASRTLEPMYESIQYSTKLPELWSRQWTLHATPTESYVTLRSSPLATIIGVSGVLFASAIALYIYILSNQTVTIRRMVDEKTQELTEANEKLSRISRTDGLTGVYNRRYLDELLEKEWKMAFRNQNCISVILFDIDFFKPYNDTYGHPQGDTCIRQVAKALQNELGRPSDILARYGGEEFIAVLPDTSKAELIAERCRIAVTKLELPHSASEVSDIVTVSAGVCSLTPLQHQSIDDLIEAADQALYQAKSTGRNRIASASESKLRKLV